MPRAGVALRDVRNAEDRTCPTFSCFSLQHRHEGLPWTSTWGDGNYSQDMPNDDSTEQPVRDSRLILLLRS